MAAITPKPYKLINKIQNYDWGTKNEHAVIPHLLGMMPVPDLAYAELWIGAHPKAPSEIVIDGQFISLIEAIKQFPVEILGKYVHNKFGSTLPFLLKVLSAARALSIQAHPDKVTAKHLHSANPENYPDDNHKPEIAIAIDSLSALAGFRPVKEIIQNLNRHPELYSFSTDAQNRINSVTEELAAEEIIKGLYASIMRSADDRKRLKKIIDSILKRLEEMSNHSEEEGYFLEQFDLYGYDIGLISFFFYNIVKLKQHQAIFTGAGIPHAYIKGNIIECMANSDNVIRAGLTGKFKDVDTLLKIIKYDFTEFNIINEEQKVDEVVFETEAEEFRVSLYNKEQGMTKKLILNNKPVIILITEGKLAAEWNDGKFKEDFKKGESFIIPSLLDEVNLYFEENSLFYLVEIP